MLCRVSVVLACVLACLMAAAGPACGQVRIELARPVMGTDVRIIACTDDFDHGAKAVVAAMERMAEVDSVLSDYNPGSEVMRLAQGYRVGVPVSVSADLARALLEADRWWMQTGGAFDASLGAMTRAWRRAVRRGEMPDPEVMERAGLSSGWRHVSIDSASGSVTFSVAGTVLDFGGIGKGWAMDQALAVLREHGVDRVLIDAGGDLLAGTPPPGDPGWLVALPRYSRDALEGVPGRDRVWLAASALATSGDRYQYIESDGVRYSHILDPQTGVGMTDRRTVTVWAPDGTAADALATAFSVADPDRLEHLVSGPAHGVRILRPVGPATLLGSMPDPAPDDAMPADCRPRPTRLD